MKAIVKTYLCDEEGRVYFGYEPMLLLERVAETGSLNQAARNMGMAYTKAFEMIKKAERGAGFPLLDRSIGGSKGGGSRMTPEGEALLEKYRRYREDCNRESERLFRKYFKD